MCRFLSEAASDQFFIERVHVGRLALKYVVSKVLTQNLFVAQYVKRERARCCTTLGSRRDEAYYADRHSARSRDCELAWTNNFFRFTLNLKRDLWLAHGSHPRSVRARCDCRPAPERRSSERQELPEGIGEYAKSCVRGDCLKHAKGCAQRLSSRSLCLTSMKVPNETALRRLALRLNELEPKIPYHLWIEQPYVPLLCVSISHHHLVLIHAKRKHSDSSCPRPKFSPESAEEAPRRGALRALEVIASPSSCRVDKDMHSCRRLEARLR